jgi:hypothetical protein
MGMTRRQALQSGGVTAAWLLLPVDARAIARSVEDAIADVGSAARPLPTWFGANRVHGHTRLTFSLWHDTREFTEAAAGFKALGAGAFARHVKSGDEDPWWPTALPLGPDGRPLADRDGMIDGAPLVQGRNVAKEIIDEAHAEGLNIITYYWHMSEARLARLRPEWVCKRPNGTPIMSPRGTYLDITGPYREVVLGRLLELADMGADGFLFDHRHLPREGCWGSAFAQAWTAETGLPAPPAPMKGEPPSSRYLAFIDFRARKIEETFTYWRDRVKARHPKVVFVISTDDFAGLMDRGVTTRLARIADSAKNEYHQALHRGVTRNVFEKHRDVLAEPPGHVRQSLSWTALRDSSEGRPPHIWHPGVPTADQAVALAGSLLTFGAVANMDAAEESLIDQKDQRGKTPVEGLKRAFALGKVVSPHLARIQPLRWAAVHFGESSRSKRRADYLAMWQQVLWPLVGAYQVLSEDGLPIGVVNDDQLEQGRLDGYRLLILPNPDELTSAQRGKVATFKARGGVVIENDPAWPWSDPDGTDAAAAALRTALRAHVESAPLQVTGGPAGRYAVSYRKPGRLIVAVTNNFSWVQFSTRNRPIPPHKIKRRPPPAQNVYVTWRRGHGLPQTSGGDARLQQLRAIEAVTGRTLPVKRVAEGYRVDLPKVAFMALLVVRPARS